MLAIYRKEISNFFNNLTGYLVMVVFLTFIGLYMWVFPDTSVLEYGFADMESLFLFGPVAFLLLIPAITMRSIAEEKHDGTLELLLTRPVSVWQLLLGKYFAALTLVIFALIPTVVYYYSLSELGNPPGNLDTAGIFTSYIGMILLGAVFCAIGLFGSAISGNQIVAFIIGLIFCYIFYDGFVRLASLDFWEEQAFFLEWISLQYQYEALSKGVIDTRNVFYFLSVIVISLSATKLVLDSRKW